MGKTEEDTIDDLLDGLCDGVSDELHIARVAEFLTTLLRAKFKKCEWVLLLAGTEEMEVKGSKGNASIVTSIKDPHYVEQLLYASFDQIVTTTRKNKLN